MKEEGGSDFPFYGWNAPLHVHLLEGGGAWAKGTQTNIERDSGSIQRFMYSGGA